MQLTVQDAFALAARHEAAGRVADARALYEQILAALPEHPGALLKMAQQELAAGEHELGLARLARALAAAQAQSLPAPEIWRALARAHLARGDPDQAQVVCRRGLEQHPRDASLLRLLGDALKACGAAAEACKLLAESAALAPDDPGVRIDLGGALLDAGRPAEARKHLERAIALGAPGGEVWDNLGLACRMLKDDEAALHAFEQAVRVEPALTPARANLVHTRQYLCNWDDLDASERELTATLDDPASDPRWSPFVALAMPLSEAQQLAVARRWSRAMLPAPAVRRMPPRRGARLRIGYLSANFHEHPTARLMAGLFEEHDRSRFEITGYSYGPDDGSALRARVRAAFDRWRDVRNTPDTEVGQLIREDGIDLLIDRAGHTFGSRLAILARRPAPVQLHYMSFPGTIGYDAIDGIIADAEVVPPGDEIFYHERVWRLPRCYYVNDRRRGLPAPAERAEHGLPVDALVLACLNQSYKLRRAFFDVWMDALRARPDAVLWLLQGHPRTQANLKREAARAGIDPERLIFAPRMAQEAHIARLRCADLALDTLPYGAHTTGVDALWAGVPMLTCRGTTFAGRVGASVLLQAGLPDLIAHSIEEYRARLLELAADPATLRRYQEYLNRTRYENTLFDTAGFARDWERLLVQVYDECSS
jgi:predicted O-linked N-acetylglucosamine transferase (SPINDLY family)